MHPPRIHLTPVKPTPLFLLTLAALLTAHALAAEPKAAESTARSAAVEDERRGDWPGAGYHWEQAAQAAELADEADRAIVHAGHALAAWQKVPGALGRDRQTFALGLMSKLEIQEGRLTSGRQHNLDALALITARLRETSGWEAKPGAAPPRGAPAELLEAWARGQRDTANWLDAQGKTVAAVELLTATEQSLRAAHPDGRPLGYYHRKVISTRAFLLNFLGYQERAIADFQMLAETGDPAQASMEWPQRENLAYFSAQFYGPKPEYLDAVRALFREREAAGRADREARRMLAKMAYAYGETGANIEDLRGVVAEARASGAHLEALYAQRDLAVISSQRGRQAGVEKALLEALAGVRQRGQKRGEPTLYREYAHFLTRANRLAEALPMLLEAVRMTRAFGWTLHLPQLLNDVADLQAQLGDEAGVLRTLAELDALLAGGQLVPAREFLARCARARVLLLLGRTAEAEAEIARAKALADRAGLNDYQRFALQWTKNVKPMGAGTAAATVASASQPERAGLLDLEPVAVIATAPPGEQALARFRLSNTTAQAAEGRLTVQGVGVAAHLDAASGIIVVTAGQPEGADSATLPLAVGPGNQVIIEAEATVAAKSAGLRLVWDGAGHTLAATSHFQPETAPKGAGTDEADLPGATVDNTSLAFANPFYAVHLHHPFRIERDGAAHSFRVHPSQRCRVEVLDARTGAVLAIDADGDGAFTSQGDSLALDADADGAPDFPADPATGAGEIEILIYPLPGQPPAARDTRIVLEAKTPTGWQALAHDTLKPPRPAK